MLNDIGVDSVLISVLGISLLLWPMIDLYINQFQLTSLSLTSALHCLHFGLISTSLHLTLLSECNWTIIV